MPMENEESPESASLPGGEVNLAEDGTSPLDGETAAELDAKRKIARFHVARIAQDQCKDSSILWPYRTPHRRGSGGWRKDFTMRKVVRCACGVELRGVDENELIKRVQQHAREAHDLALSEEQVRDMMEVDQ
jgi:predicted small metal-binding protein